MWSQGLTAGPFRLEGLIRATQLLRMRLPFAMTQVNGERLVHANDIPPLLSIVHIARRVAAHYGIATVSKVAAKLRKKPPGVNSRNLVASVLAHERSFRWLDRSREWFWSETGLNPALHRIRKILSVVSPVRASDLLAGIARSARMKGFSPPIEVLLEFCRQAPGLHVRDNAIVAKFRVNPDEVLSQIEKQIVHTLSQKRRDRDRLRNQVGLPSHGAEFYDLLPLSCEFAIHFEVRAQPVWVDRTRRGNSKRSCLSRAKVTKTSRSSFFSQKSI